MTNDACNTQMDKNLEKKTNRQMSVTEKKNLECKREKQERDGWLWWMVRVSRFYDDELNDLIECMYEGIYIYLYL